MSEKATAPHRFPCRQCGADAEYVPKVGLQCPFCGHSQGEPQSPDQIIEELSFSSYLTHAKKGYEAPQSQELKCKGCGASTTLASDAMGTQCPFCGSPVVIEKSADDVIRPEGVLPFHVKKDEVVDRFRKWVSKLWFAPNALKHMARSDRVQGVYRPHWTFDSATRSWYVGERGEHYFVTEHYTDSQGRRQSRQVRKTRWHPASGEVSELFDDVLTPGGRPLEWKTEYNLSALKPYDPGFLAGWQAEHYTTSPEKAWPAAKTIIDEEIARLCRADIGGDEQRLTSVRTAYSAIKFKHVLLPLYLSAYAYGAKTFRFQANGQTGEIRGQRPYSVWKILFFILFLALCGVSILALMSALQAS